MFPSVSSSLIVGGSARACVLSMLYCKFVTCVTCEWWVEVVCVGMLYAMTTVRIAGGVVWLWPWELRVVNCVTVFFCYHICFFTPKCICSPCVLFSCSKWSSVCPTPFVIDIVGPASSPMSICAVPGHPMSLNVGELLSYFTCVRYVLVLQFLLTVVHLIWYIPFFPIWNQCYLNNCRWLMAVRVWTVLVHVFRVFRLYTQILFYLYIGFSHSTQK